MPSSDSNSRPVFSSDMGELCRQCGQVIQRCDCKKRSVDTPTGDRIRVSLQSKGRGGKAVSLIDGLPLDDVAIKALAKKLKKRCGTGGAVKNGVIEIQGDHRALLISELAKQGFAAKKSGGK